MPQFFRSCEYPLVRSGKVCVTAKRKDRRKAKEKVYFPSVSDLHVIVICYFLRSWLLNQTSGLLASLGFGCMLVLRFLWSVLRKKGMSGVCPPVRWFRLHASL